MRGIRKSDEGVVITPGGVAFAKTTLGVLGVLAVGAAGAIRFYEKTNDAPTRAEFVRHEVREDSIHTAYKVHDAFQDSAIVRALRTAEQAAQDNHATACVVAPSAVLCRDVTRVTPRR